MYQCNRKDKVFRFLKTPFQKTECKKMIDYAKTFAQASNSFRCPPLFHMRSNWRNMDLIADVVITYKSSKWSSFLFFRHEKIDIWDKVTSFGHSLIGSHMRRIRRKIPYRQCWNKVNQYIVSSYMSWYWYYDNRRRKHKCTVSTTMKMIDDGDQKDHQDRWVWTFLFLPSYLFDRRNK